MGQKDPVHRNKSVTSRSHEESKTDSVDGLRSGAVDSVHSHLWLFLILGLIVPVSAFLPMLVNVARELWLQPPFRFFPIAIVAGTALLVGTCKFGYVSGTRAWVATMILIAGMLLGLWGMYLISSTRVQLAVVLVILGWALGWYGATSWTRIVAIWSIFLVTVPMPFSLSERVAQFLQTIAGSACNGFLEAIYIPSVFEGGVLRAEGVELPVYEIGRDAGGLLALMAFALTWVVFWRRPFVVGKAVVFSVIVCVLMASVSRLLVVLFAKQWWGLDLLGGWFGIGVGIATFLISVLFVICSDYAATAWFAPLNMGETPNNAMRTYQRFVAWPTPEVRRWHDRPATDRTWMFIGVPSVLCLVFGAMTFYALHLQSLRVSPLDSVMQQVAERLPGENVFPEQFANLKRTHFVSESREKSLLVGKHTQSWKLEGGDAIVHVSLDFPLSVVSSPENFYELTGWEIRNRNSTEVPEPAPWLIKQVNIANRFGVSATAWHAHFDESGKPADATAMANNARATLFGMMKQPETDSHRYFQVRMFIETGRELTSEQLEPYQKLFLQVFERLRQSTAETLNASL